MVNVFVRVVLYAPATANITGIRGAGAGFSGGHAEGAGGPAVDEPRPSVSIWELHRVAVGLLRSVRTVDRLLCSLDPNLT